MIENSLKKFKSKLVSSGLAYTVNQCLIAIERIPNKATRDKSGKLLYKSKKSMWCIDLLDLIIWTPTSEGKALKLFIHYNETEHLRRLTGHNNLSMPMNF